MLDAVVIQPLSAAPVLSVVIGIRSVFVAGSFLVCLDVSSETIFVGRILDQSLASVDIVQSVGPLDCAAPLVELTGLLSEVVPAPTVVDIVAKLRRGQAQCL